MKLSQKTGFLAHFERLFNYTLLCPDKLWRYIILVSLISDAFVGVKLSIFKCFHVRCSIFEMWSLLGEFLGPFSPKYDPILLKFWPEVISDKAKKRQFMSSLPKLCLSRNETYPKFTVLVHFWLGQIYPLKTQNIAKSQNFSKNYILRNIK